MGNLENKVVYYNVDLDEFNFTYLNNDARVFKKIALSSIIGYPLLKLLNNIIVFENVILQLLILVICYIMSVKIAKILFKMDNPEQEKKEFYKDEKIIKELLISWRNKTVVAMLILTIDIILIIITIYIFFITGSVYSLFFFSPAVILFEVGNIDVVKRFNLLNRLIKKY